MIRIIMLSDSQRELIEKAAELQDQSKIDYSKPMNFYLNYQSPHGDILKEFWKELITEIESQELATGYRKNKRAVNVRKRLKQSIQILVLNLIQMRWFGDNLQLAISLNRNTYNLKAAQRYSPPNVTYDTFKDAYQGLLRCGYVHEKHKGFYDAIDGTGMVTRIIPKDKLLSAFKDAVDGQTIQIARPKKDTLKEELLILKDEKKSKINYSDTKYTNKARSDLKRINKVLLDHDISLGELNDKEHRDLKYRMEVNHRSDPDRSGLLYLDFNSVRLQRIFNDGHFKSGGRFYRGWWQNVPKKYRKHILIDGQKTVELDYSRFHITIMYAELGLKQEFDAYDIDPRISIDISKHTINALISSKGVTKKHDDFYEEEIGMSWEQYIELIMEKHKPLVDAGMLMKRYGLTLQFKDAELANSILLHFTKKGVPCLPIHDSFIIAEEYGDELREVMFSMFKDKFKADIIINRK